jgi:hypothetical protein
MREAPAAPRSVLFGESRSQWGFLVVQFVGQNTGRASVEEAVSKQSADVRVRYEEVTYSRAELLEVANEVLAMRLKGVVGIAPATISNRVRIDVGPWGSTSEVASAVEKFGAAVEIGYTPNVMVAANCNTVTNCTPWRGGIEIVRNDVGWACTWGFQASKDGFLIMVTAGHCHHTGGKFNHHGVTIGSNGVSKNAMDQATYEAVDVSRTRVTCAGAPTTQNRIFLNPDHKSWPMTSAYNNAQFYDNMLVAKSGIETGDSYGQLDEITYLYQLIPGEGEGSLMHWPDCTWETPDECPWMVGAKADVSLAWHGDSGAPVFTYTWDWQQAIAVPGHDFVGTISVANGLGDVVFARAQDIKNVLGLDFWCTTPGCP